MGREHYYKQKGLRHPIQYSGPSRIKIPPLNLYVPQTDQIGTLYFFHQFVFISYYIWEMQP